MHVERAPGRRGAGVVDLDASPEENLLIDPIAIEDRVVYYAATDADHRWDVANDAEPEPVTDSTTYLVGFESGVEMTRTFDAEVGHITAPFASILLRTESASSSEIENLTSDARSARPADTEPLRKRLETLKQAVPEGWRARADSEVRASLEESMERLGVDRIPLLHLHDPEHAHPPHDHGDEPRRSSWGLL